MLPFRRILAPIDYSEPCKAVLPFVKDAVEHFDAELTLVHAYGPEALAFSQLEIADPELPEQVRAIEEDRILEFANEMFPDRRVETLVELGEPGTVIREIVQRQGTDLVMLATHGRGPMRRLLLGSVTAKVLHDISTPVWTGSPRALAAASAPYKSILCALELDADAECVMRAGAALAESYRADLFLVNVVATPPAAWDVDFTGIQKDLIDAADLRLRELKRRLNVDAPHTVMGGAIAATIAAEAAKHHAGLIVTGRGHAQDRLNRMWSNLYPIVREAPCPVLSI